MKKNIKCSECRHCRGYKKPGNTRSSFACEHPDTDYIRKYFQERRIKKMEGFLGYGEPFSEECPIKTSPAWCPKKTRLRV